MKFLFSVFALILTFSSSFAAEVMSAKIDQEGKNLLINVKFSGGCEKHEFTLEMHACAGSNPVQCEVELKEKSADRCELDISALIEIPLEKYGFNDPYYKNGLLVILGDKNWQTDQVSRATVILP